MNPLSITQENLVVAYDKDYFNDDNDNDLLGFGQIRPLSDSHSELASLYVLPRCRRQGVGQLLIETLLQRHDEKYTPNDDSPAPEVTPVVCLLTLRPTMPLYEKFGFVEVTDTETLPLMLQMEYKAGQALSKVLKNEIVCMERKSPEGG